MTGIKNCRKISMTFLTENSQLNNKFKDLDDSFSTLPNPGEGELGSIYHESMSDVTFMPLWL